MDDSHILLCAGVFLLAFHLGRQQALQQSAAAQAAQVPPDPSTWFAHVFDGSFSR